MLVPWVKWHAGCGAEPKPCPGDGHSGCKGCSYPQLPQPGAQQHREQRQGPSTAGGSGCPSFVGCKMWVTTSGALTEGTRGRSVPPRRPCEEEKWSRGMGGRLCAQSGPGERGSGRGRGGWGGGGTAASYPTFLQSRALPGSGFGHYLHCRCEARGHAAPHAHEGRACGERRGAGLRERSRGGSLCRAVSPRSGAAPARRRRRRARCRPSPAKGGRSGAARQCARSFAPSCAPSPQPAAGGGAGGGGGGPRPGCGAPRRTKGRLAGPPRRCEPGAGPSVPPAGPSARRSPPSGRAQRSRGGRRGAAPMPGGAAGPPLGRAAPR